MTLNELRARWLTPEGRVRAQNVFDWLIGGQDPSGDTLGYVNGRLDLRGFAVPSHAPSGMLSVSGYAVVEFDNVQTIVGRRWVALDLSHAQLPGIKFFDTAMEDCVFTGANCRGWRLWGCRVVDSSFAGVDFRESALGTWRNGRGNSWEGVSFDRADLRTASFSGSRLTRCSFHDSRIDGVHFLQMDISHCVFSGTLRDVLFDCRAVPNERIVGPMIDVDFHDARFIDVDFRGCRLEPPILPERDSITLVERYPAVARRMLERLSDDPSLNARMLAAELRGTLQLAGGDDTVGIFNRRDYVASGGEALADLVVVTAMEAVASLDE